MADLPGVEFVHVDLPTGMVRVALTVDQPATEEQLAQAVVDSGFTLEEIEMPQ